MTFWKGVLIICFIGSGCALKLFGQEASIQPILPLRAEESYTFLRDNDSTDFFLREWKYVPIAEGGAFLTIGGEYRARVEHTTNVNYSSEDETYYSRRLNLHVGLQVSAHFRIFSELYHGSTTDGERSLESDQIDLHQGFLEYETLEGSNFGLQIRLGRQEIGYGVSRLVGIREGPNMRRSFDLARMIIRFQDKTLDLFAGKEVSVDFGAFDNTSDLFRGEGPDPNLWGAYYRTSIFGDVGKLDAYYFGFYTNRSRFGDINGEEWRHSVGARSFGSKGRLSYNTELVFQFGKLATASILAYNFETDWKYSFSNSKWQPKLGLKLDWSSGDRNQGDDRIGTFNPLFVNPAIYSLAAVNTPANILSWHPNVTCYPADRMNVYFDYAIFYRTQLDDGLYAPPRFLVREPINRERHIGNVIGLQVQYEINRNISCDLRSSYFIAGAFLKASGNSENIFYVAPTVSFKF